MQYQGDADMAKFGLKKPTAVNWVNSDWKLTWNYYNKISKNIKHWVWNFVLNNVLEWVQYLLAGIKISDLSLSVLCSNVLVNFHDRLHSLVGAWTLACCEVSQNSTELVGLQKWTVEISHSNHRIWWIKSNCWNVTQSSGAYCMVEYILPNCLLSS